MTVAAQAYSDGRGAERVLAGRGATLRDSVSRPIDIVIADLSVTGFGMMTSADLPVGSLLHLNLAGISKRDVRVTRRHGAHYGCEFTPPLSPDELDLALDAGVVVDASFAVTGASGSQPSRPTHFQDGKASPRLRAIVLTVTVASLWLTVLYAVHAMVRVFASA